jgi:hypothetical protein
MNWLNKQSRMFLPRKPCQRRGLGFTISAILCCFARIVFGFFFPFMMLVVYSHEGQTVCPVADCCFVRAALDSCHVDAVNGSFVHCTGCMV